MMEILLIKATFFRFKRFGLILLIKATFFRFKPGGVALPSTAMNLSIDLSRQPKSTEVDGNSLAKPGRGGAMASQSWSGLERGVSV